MHFGRFPITNFEYRTYVDSKSKINKTFLFIDDIQTKNETDRFCDATELWENV